MCLENRLPATARGFESHTLRQAWWSVSFSYRPSFLSQVLRWFCLSDKRLFVGTVKNVQVEKSLNSLRKQGVQRFFTLKFLCSLQISEIRVLFGIPPAFRFWPFDKLRKIRLRVTPVKKRFRGVRPGGITCKGEHPFAGRGWWCRFRQTYAWLPPANKTCCSSSHRCCTRPYMWCRCCLPTAP